MKKKYKLIAICQVYNELEKGNLLRFIKYVKPLCDELIIYDDGSTDGSYEFLLKHTPHVFRRGKNDFSNEMEHKKILVERAKALGADFIFYLDSDEVFTANASDRLQELAQMCIDKDIDGLQFHKINIWRSATWQRVDSLYDIGWFTHFWRVTPDMKYASIKRGLHQAPYPSTIRKIEKVTDVSILHYGFSNEKNLAYKYITYKSHGQRGYDTLDRLLDEHKMELKKIPKEFFPKGLYVKDDPAPHKIPFAEALSYVEKHKPQILRPKYSIVCLIYKSVQWLQFVYEQVLKYTDMKDVEFYFVANDATPEVLEYLKNNYIPHYIWDNTEEHKKEWYINNVYRAWNFGAKQAKGDFIIFVNSDMAFSPNWLENLIAGYHGQNCVTSRLVESGKMESGQYGIGKNFGRSISSYYEKGFQKYASAIAINDIKPGGLYMPLFIRKKHFLSVEGYPEGNPLPGSDIFHPKLAKLGELSISGDTIFMAKLQSQGIIHETTFSSIVYHFQEGEMDSSLKKTKESIRQYIGISSSEEFQVLKKLPSVTVVEHPQTQTSESMAIMISDMQSVDDRHEDKYNILFVSRNDLVKKYFKQLSLANMLITDSFEVMSYYRDYTFSMIPTTRKDKLIFWKEILEKAFMQVRIEEIKHKQFADLPTVEKMKRYAFIRFESVTGTAHTTKNKVIYKLRQIKHSLFDHKKNNG